MAVPEIRVIGITGLPELHPGDDLGGMLVRAAEKQGTSLQSGDVLVVTQKVVSKAVGRLVALESIQPSEFAQTIAKQYDKDPRHVEAVLRESRRIVRMDRGVIITENLLGQVCANAGIDASNLAEAGYLALLPADPDRWCREAHSRVQALANADVGVVMSDTFGRPWREGCTNVAIGVAGMPAVVDYRGQVDTSGYVLRVSILAIADELASAAELVMAKFDRIPAAIVRGYPYAKVEGKASDLLRAPDKDMFR